MATEFNYEGAAERLNELLVIYARIPEQVHADLEGHASDIIAAFLADNEHEIVSDDGEVVVGGFSTAHDALVAREWVERAMAPEFFWIRRAGGSDEQRCHYCKGWFPNPVELHHSEDECIKAGADG